MSTIGELKDIGVADLIDVFARRNKSGCLTVKTNGQEVQITFDNGRMVSVSSSDITLRLGRMLVRQGLIDTQRLLEGLHLQTEGGFEGPRQTLGAILIERGWVTEFDVARCIEEQSIEALARIITDSTGIFVFDPAAPKNVASESPALDTVYLLDAAKERVDALNMLREQLPPPGVPIFLSAVPEDDDALDALAPPESMVIGVLKSGAKSYSELSFNLALDELSLGVAVLTLVEQGTLVVGTSHLKSRRGSRAPVSIGVASGN